MKRFKFPKENDILSRHYEILPDIFHYKWSRSHDPALTVKEGDTVTFEINDVGSWQLNENSGHGGVMRFDSAKLYPLAGPVFVEGAKPGDALIVEVVRVDIGDFGWSFIQPGFGLLEEFTEPFLYKWDLKDKKSAAFEKGIRIPLNPFCGVLGVAPKTRGLVEVGPPGRHAEAWTSGT